jgi:hypothetical protein
MPGFSLSCPDSAIAPDGCPVSDAAIIPDRNKSVKIAILLFIVLRCLNQLNLGLPRDYSKKIKGCPDRTASNFLSLETGRSLLLNKALYQRTDRAVVKTGTGLMRFSLPGFPEQKASNQ